MGSKQLRIIDHFISSEINELSLDEFQFYERQWLDTFCNYRSSERSRVHIDQYKWHTFSYDKYPCSEGQDAIAEYLQQETILYVVLPELRRANSEEVAFTTVNTPPVELTRLSADFYVFPKNLAWTFAFTHEEPEIGPYFAKHKDYKRLNRKNQQAVHAKQVGW